MNAERRRCGAISVRDVAIAMVVVGLATMQSACKKEPPPNHLANMHSAITWHFTCPDTSPVLILGDSSGTVVDTVDSIPLSGPTANIPEYHDCQRFIENGAYGSVYAIFAGFRLEASTKREQIQYVPVATIYTPDGKYPTLAIEPGFNCLLLFKSGAQWLASMIPQGQGSHHADCAKPTGTPHPLTVREKPIGDSPFTGASYPEAARWDWDPKNERQYIGVRCGDSWCEVGAEGFQSSAPFEASPWYPLKFEPINGAPTLSSAEMLRTQRIKGWYDEQRLAITSVSGSQQPGTVLHAYLIPNPQLDVTSWTPAALKYYEPSFVSPGWVHVADAVLDNDYPKWNYSKGVNKIYMCHGFGTRCARKQLVGRQESASDYQLDNCPTTTDDPTPWLAKTVSSAGKTTYVCVRRHNHKQLVDAWNQQHPGLSFKIPGAARWKFLLKDESTWVGCPTGCCAKQ